MTSGKDMDEGRHCTVCGAPLVGPMAPRITLTWTLSDEQSKIDARAWVCAACGLVHWYGEEGSVARLQAAVGEVEEYEAEPGASYERRVQVLRMLRRVRRM